MIDYSDSTLEKFQIRVVLFDAILNISNGFSVASRLLSTPSSCKEVRFISIGSSKCDKKYDVTLSQRSTMEVFKYFREDSS